MTLCRKLYTNTGTPTGAAAAAAQQKMAELCGAFLLTATTPTTGRLHRTQRTHTPCASTRSLVLIVDRKFSFADHTARCLRMSMAQTEYGQTIAPPPHLSKWSGVPFCTEWKCESFFCQFFVCCLGFAILRSIHSISKIIHAPSARDPFVKVIFICPTALLAMMR